MQNSLIYDTIITLIILYPMSNQEKYSPSEVEIKRAEETMTGDQASLSWSREHQPHSEMDKMQPSVTEQYWKDEYTEPKPGENVENTDRTRKTIRAEYTDEAGHQHKFKVAKDVITDFYGTIEHWVDGVHVESIANNGQNNNPEHKKLRHLIREITNSAHSLENQAGTEKRNKEEMNTWPKVEDKE